MHYAKLQWQDSGEPLSTEFGDVYFSKNNGLAEARYVFLQANQLQQRFQNLAPDAHFVIAETGFGTGLNFLAAVRLWHEFAPKTAKLIFVSCEKYPVSYYDLEKALSLWNELKAEAKMLLNVYPMQFYIGQTLLNVAQNIHLTLLIDDAVCALIKIDLSVDAWFLDGFAPAKNPDMWSDNLFKEIYRLSHNKTTLATFTAAGFVKRALEFQGFDVKKQKGFGFKREMITAKVKNLAKQSESKLKPYFIKPKFTADKSEAIAVIGAGMAGCTIAYELDCLGFKVDLYDACDDIAQKASGNPYGVLRPYITVDANLSDLFHTQGFIYTREYILKHQGEINFLECGVLELLNNNDLKTRFDNIMQKRGLNSDLLQLLDAKNASKIAGCDISTDCAYYPTAMMVNPYSLCKSLLNHSTYVSAFLSHKLQSLLWSDKAWQLNFIANHGVEKSLNYSCVVFAGNALLMQEIEVLKHLETYPSYGQITQVEKLVNNRVILLDKGYILPSVKNMQVIGATFRANNDLAGDIRCEDDYVNLHQLKNIIDTTKLPDKVKSRVSLRCVTSDHVPMVGSIADNQNFYAQYHDKLQKGVISKALPRAHYLPGLYVLSAFGSKGLSAMFHAAKLLSRLLADGENAPISNNIVEGLHPLRFNVRTFRKK